MFDFFDCCRRDRAASGTNRLLGTVYFQTVAACALTSSGAASMTYPMDPRTWAQYHGDIRWTPESYEGRTREKESFTKSSNVTVYCPASMLASLPIDGPKSLHETLPFALHPQAQDICVGESMSTPKIPSLSQYIPVC
ncbi:uncharacterized protein LY89DRAFT_264012 [Mollisia scopiformis]|uniref:Uncharacterized protein n=1 Tax=Mollisia scopiformis TaxID=149040 RepID=A0A132BEX0_MOLSC|nr:uncharacterized protein LY89DRAFT_264012 [Mollisia scopiformis]KUJ10569.1 hypothetical protein LY89DRAFT_264012 [Mollisia scopiformis]